MSADLVPVGLEFVAKGHQQTTAAAEGVTAATAKAEKATDSLASAQKRSVSASEQAIASIEREVRELVALTRAQGAAVAASQAMERASRDAAKAANDGAAAAKQFGTQFNSHIELFRKHAAGSKLAGHEMLIFGRQLGDVVTMASMGASPMMIITSQGAQIAEQFAIAGARGIGFSAALKQMTTAAWGFIGPWAPIAATIALAVAGIWALVSAYQAATKASAETQKATEANAKATDTYVKAAQAAERATGDLKVMLDADAEAARRNAEQTRKATQEKLNLAKASLAAAQAQLSTASQPGAPSYASSGIGLAGTIRERQARSNVDALTKSLRDQDIAIKQLEQDMASGGRTMVESLRQQNAEYGKTRAQVILMNAAVEAAKPANKQYAASIMEQAREAARHADAEDRRKAALQASRSETAKATEAGLAFIQSMRDQTDAIGANEYELRILEARRLAATMPTKALSEAVIASAVAFNEEARAAKEAADALAKRNAEAEAGYKREWERQTTNGFTFKPSTGAGVPQTTVKMPELLIDKIKLDADAKQRLRDDFGSTLADGIRAAFNGDLKNFLRFTFEQMFDRGLRMAFKALDGGGLGAFGGSRTMQAGNIAATGAMLIGSAIGGKAGGALSGAGAGAMMGSTFGPPGMVIGAVIGGIAGLFGASKAAKRAAEEARKAATEQAEAQIRAVRERQAAIAAERRSTEIDIMEAANDNLGALAARRKDELEAAKALDPALAALKQRLFDMQDLVTERDRLQGVVDTAKEQLRQAYDAEMQQLQDDYDRRKSEAEAARDQMASFAQGIRAVRESLSGGSGSAANFWRTATEARLGDKDALGALPDLARQQVETIRATARTELEAARGIAQVRAALSAAEQTALRQVSAADAQLRAIEDGFTAQKAALAAQVGGLIEINNSVLSVRQAVDNLAGATSALAAANQAIAAAQSAAPPAGGAAGGGRPDYAGYVASYGDLSSYYSANAASLAKVGYGSLESFGQYHWNANGQGENRTLPTFARGGFHRGGVRMVGEEGPEIEATGPARYWSAQQTADMMSDGSADMSRVEAKLDRLITVMEKAARGTTDTADILRATTDGNALTTKAA